MRLSIDCNYRSAQGRELRGGRTPGPEHFESTWLDGPRTDATGDAPRAMEFVPRHPRHPVYRQRSDGVKCSPAGWAL